MAEQNIGSVGSVTESYSKGVASVDAEVKLPQTSYGLEVVVSIKGDLDASKLIAYLAGKIGGPIPAEVASFLEGALKVI